VPLSGAAKPELITQFGLHTRFELGGTTNFEYSMLWLTAILMSTLRGQAYDSLLNHHL
jgi:hypothetical protein